MELNEAVQHRDRLGVVVLQVLGVAVHQLRVGRPGGVWVILLDIVELLGRRRVTLGVQCVDAVVVQRLDGRVRRVLLDLLGFPDRVGRAVPWLDAFQRFTPAEQGDDRESGKQAVYRHGAPVLRQAPYSEKVLRKRSASWNRRSIVGIALLGPRIAPVMVAAHLPEARLVGGHELDPLQPLGALPQIQMRHDQPHRAAMLAR